MYVIYGNPSISSLTTVKSLGFVKDVEGLTIEKGPRRLLALPFCRVCSVQLKLEKLRELGFIGEEVGIIVQRLPELLGRPI